MSIGSYFIEYFFSRGALDMIPVYNFIVYFFLVLIITFILDFITRIICRSHEQAFVLLHIICLPFIDDFSGVLWIILTVSHGLMHIFYPAFFGEIYNTEYSPLYDYIVHAAQCLTVYFYDPNQFVFGIYFSMLMLTGAIVSHVDKKFLETKLWIFVSGFGVYGTHYHMMLLNKEHDQAIYCASLIIWLLPYVGYIKMNTIPQWDRILNMIGLFRYWYLNFFICIHFYQYLNK